MFFEKVNTSHTHICVYIYVYMCMYTQRVLVLLVLGPPWTPKGYGSHVLAPWLWAAGRCPLGSSESPRVQVIPVATKTIIFCRFPMISIYGFIRGTYKTYGYGSQWYRGPEYIALGYFGALGNGLTSCLKCKLPRNDDGTSMSQIKFPISHGQQILM